MGNRQAGAQPARAAQETCRATQALIAATEVGSLETEQTLTHPRINYTFARLALKGLTMIIGEINICHRAEVEAVRNPDRRKVVLHIQQVGQARIEC